MRCFGTSLFRFLPPTAAWSAMCAVLVGGCSRGPAIVLDGSFDDWSGIKAVVNDPPDFAAAAAGFVDFGSVTLAHDEQYVHLLINLGNEVNPQGLQGTARLMLDGDGDPGTGQSEHGLDGVDLIVELTPPDARRPDRPGRGIGLRSTTYQPDPEDESQKPLSPYDIGFSFAPTYAASKVEFRLERGVTLPHTPILLAGRQFSGKLVFVDASGTIVDETDAFTYRLTRGSKREPPFQRFDPLARSDDALRIVDWNAKRNGVFLNREPAVRTLRAIDPDIVLMQEWMDGVTVEQLRDFFRAELGWEDA